MIKTGFETRVKTQQIIENQLPEFILEESPKTVDFLKQYYISQEYQGGPVDIAENLDQYLKVDNLRPEIIVDTTSLTSSINSNDTVIFVSSTKGFPQKYGLIKIDNEIITYTGITESSFTGCVRGFSGISTYRNEEAPEELVFSSTTASSHNSGASIQNLSSLFLKEFYNKFKFTFTPGLEGVDFTSGLNVGNFIKEAKSLYTSKGTDESFRILFNVLYGVTPKVINLENFLIKPSSADFIRREVLVVEPISGDPNKIVGGSIFKSSDNGIIGSVSEVEPITRKGVTYYQVSLFVGYDDSASISDIIPQAGKTIVTETVAENATVINVDSTIGFSEAGTLIYNNNLITYTGKSVNQFYGCSGITFNIPATSSVRSNETCYGYDNSDITRKIEFRVTGVISSFEQVSENFVVSENDNIYVNYLGDIIENPKENKTTKQIIANSWIYNTSSRYQVSNISGSSFKLTDSIDKSSLKKGDRVEVLIRDSETIVSSETNIPIIKDVNENTNQIDLDNLVGFAYNPNLKYDIRRKLKKASSSLVSFETGNNTLLSDVLNVYSDDANSRIYVASNSLPSYNIIKKIFKISISEATEPRIQGYDSLSDTFSIISFDNDVPFATGDEVQYSAQSEIIPGLEEGPYFIEVLENKNQIRLYISRSFIGSSNYVKFESLTSGSGSHFFTLSSQKNESISPQKLLKEFPLKSDLLNGRGESTLPGTVGMLINGVEIQNYKTNDRVYYGPLEKVNVINSGSEYDVLNPPLIEVVDGSGSGAKIQPVVKGSVKSVFVDPQSFDVETVVSIALTGGNGKGSRFSPVIVKRTRELDFDARSLTESGGVDVDEETITFLSKHNLKNGDPLIYVNNGNSSIGIATFKSPNTNSGESLKNGSTYYCKVVNDRTVQLYNNILDYTSGINTVGFTTVGLTGIHKFKTQETKSTLKEIKVIDPGEGYENRTLIVKSSGISTVYDTVTFNNHGFNDGDLIEYNYQTTSITGLTTYNQYYVLKENNNSFRLCDAGVGATIRNNYDRKNYVKFLTNGAGYQYFKYPKISFVINYSSVGVGTSVKTVGIITATPIITGNIVDAYLYENGSGYGSKVLNIHRKPKVLIKTGRDAQLDPVVVNGSIQRVAIQFGGFDYYSTPTLIVSGKGTGAKLRPIISNGRIVNVVVINPGSEYDADTTSIRVVPAGRNGLIDCDVRYLTSNKNFKFGDEVIDNGQNGLQYSISGYTSKLREEFNDLDQSQHSPIIGWAYDGNPIYGPYGYSNPEDSNSSVKILRTGYSLKTGLVTDRPSDFPAGFFVEDYTYNGLGDLDKSNGRYCKTPEFQNGTYAYFATVNVDNIGISSFPYFVGDLYKSKIIENNILNKVDQSFDFNSSNLVRNTYPYKLNEKNSNNDFIFESYKITNQRSTIESVIKDPINSVEVVESGFGYRVNQELEFNNSETGGGGLKAIISSLTGKEITSVDTTIESYQNTIFRWKDGNTLEAKINPYHNLVNNDNIVISGLTTTLSQIKKLQKVGITSFTTTLVNAIPASTSLGIVTDIYVNDIPESVSIGSTIKIGSESLLLLNKFPFQKILRVRRDNGPAHSATNVVNFIPDKFTINYNANYFNSKFNDKIYFKPAESIGVGLSVGIGTEVVISLGVSTTGIATFVRNIPSQSIYIENHPFVNNQQVIFKKPSSSYTSIIVSDSLTGTQYTLPNSGTSQNVYVTNKTKNTIGIKTELNSSEIFFVGIGSISDSYEYSIETNYEQLEAKVEKIKSTVSVSTYHGLTYGDTITLTAIPSKVTGIRSDVVVVKLNAEDQKTLVNPASFTSYDVNTDSSIITITDHNFNSGDKVYLQGDLTATDTGEYYVYKVDDNRIKLSLTYTDSLSEPPITISIGSTGGLNQEIALINPPLYPKKNNTIKFDLSDTSLYGCNLKFFYDENFKNEFISSGSTSVFSISGLSTDGSSTGIVTAYVGLGSISPAFLNLNYSDGIPKKVYYALEKNGFISTTDTTVFESSVINFVDSDYNKKYNVIGIGSTTFEICLTKKPESLTYTQSDCDVLKYSTSSLSADGGIDKINILSGGESYKSLPDFVGVTSSDGSGAFVVAKSNTIGNINKVRILNSGFDYPSDKTLKPSAFISPYIALKDSYEISSVGIINGGRKYISPPELIVIDSVTREVFDGGFIYCTINGETINSVVIEDTFYGLSSRETEIVAVKNSNGFAVNKIESSGVGTAAIYLNTPVLGFSVAPFTIGDKIFIEGVENLTSGTGYNSKDYGYTFFTVSNFENTNPAKLSIDISGVSTNPGIAKTIQNSLASIIRYADYPVFKVSKKISSFDIGEKLLVLINDTFVDFDLSVVNVIGSNIKVYGKYNLTKNETIKGAKSGVIATIGEIDYNFGFFNVKASLIQDGGWNTDIGKTNEDYQVIEDNDYYQNMSYTIKSPIEYDTLSGTVNRLLHTSGLKNFADTEIKENVSAGIRTTEDSTIRIVDFTDEKRVDAIQNFDLAYDLDSSSTKSKFVKFKNKRLSSYIECISNRVLSIDNVNQKFSNYGLVESDQNNLDLLIDGFSGFSNYLIQTKDVNAIEYQLNEVIVLKNNTDTFLVEKLSLTNQEEKIANINVKTDSFNNTYLTFNPVNPYDTDYDIKIIDRKFSTDLVGVGTSSIGLVDLISNIQSCSSGITTSIISFNTSKYSSLHLSVYVDDPTDKNMNYVEIYLSHDGTDTYLSEYYFNDVVSTSSYSFDPLGSFNSSISGGNVILQFTNDTNNTVRLGSNIIAFGSTSLGIGTFRFNTPGQIEGTEETAIYQSNYKISSGISTVFTVSNADYSSVKSTIEVSVGSTSALYEMSFISDGTDINHTNYPFISVGSTTGIGTFNSEISGGNLNLVFYPDPTISDDVKILSFSKIIHRNIDVINVPSPLTYGPFEEILSSIEYGSVNGERMKRRNFQLYYNNDPIFVKSFNPTNSNILDPVTGIFSIKNHFYNTGEELNYYPSSTLKNVLSTPLGINTSLNNVGVLTNILPSTVYPIKLTNDTFKIATRQDYANSGIGVTFPSLGSGNYHYFEMTKKLEKSIISIDNIVQSPIAYTLVSHSLNGNGGQIGLTTTVFSISGISSIKPGDIFKVDNEYMKITNVGFGTTSYGPILGIGSIPLLQVERGSVGSSKTSHTDSTLGGIYRGSYHISGNEVWFTDPPKGDLRSTSSETNTPFFKSSFSGRVFLRKNYTTNTLYDNLSESFTGIGQTYTLTVNGINTVGLGTDGGNGILFINNIFQAPSTENNVGNNFSIVQNTVSGITSVVFSGVYSNDQLVTSDYDVNQNSLPRGGIIVSLGSTGGLGYAPLVGASVTAVLDGSGSIISVGIGTTDIFGSGYYGSVSIGVTDPSHVGSAATITAVVGAGGSLSFTVVGGGSGYVSPTIQVPSPKYENLPVRGVSRLGAGTTTDTGIGLLLNIDVGASSTTGIGSTLFEVKSFKVQRSGYGYEIGDVISPVGLVTASGLVSPISDFEITVLDTFSDSFSAWQFGELDYIDSIKDLQDGIRVRFPLYYNSNLLSFEINEQNNDSVLIDLSSVLLIFINGVLQEPGESYSFVGGSSFTFVEAPKEEDNISIFFYRGTRNSDSTLVTVRETIKKGDLIRLNKNNASSKSISQDRDRTVFEIYASDRVETDFYSGIGIDPINERPLLWAKQKKDVILNDQEVYKSRDVYESGIYPTAKIIADFSTTDTSLFVDDARFFNYEENESAIVIDSVGGLIVPNQVEPVGASITASVSSSGVINGLTINNGGSGYVGNAFNLISVKIAAPKSIGVGIGTTATAIATVLNGSIVTPIAVVNGGWGYDPSNPPQVLVVPQAPSFENITEITDVKGFAGIVTGISTVAGVGTDLAIKFDLTVKSPFSFSGTGLTTGYPIYIYGTNVGSGITSIDTNDSSIIGIGSTYVDNIYKIQSITSVASTQAYIICNILSNTSTVGIQTLENNVVGHFSWGRLSGFSRGSNPVQITVSGNTVDVGLSTFASIQRKGYGLRDLGALKKDLG